MTGCVLSGLDWWLNTLTVAALTLFARWITVGMWHECQRERARERRREQQRRSRRP